MCWEIVATVISVWILWTNTQEITDWGMMRHLFAIDFCTIRVVSLESFSNDRIQWFQEHCDIVKSSNCVCNDVFEPFNRIWGFACFFHVVRIHAAGHGWILECGPGNHGFDGEGDSGEVEISTNNFFSDNFDHFFTNWPDFIDLHFVSTDFSSFRIGVLMPMLVVVREKPRWKCTYLNAETISWASVGEGVMNP